MLRERRDEFLIPRAQTVIKSQCHSLCLQQGFFSTLKCEKAIPTFKTETKNRLYLLLLLLYSQLSKNTHGESASLIKSFSTTRFIVPMDVCWNAKPGTYRTGVAVCLSFFQVFLRSIITPHTDHLPGRSHMLLNSKGHRAHV